MPLATLRARISAAIDRHTANAAGTVAGVAVRGCWRREPGIAGTEWGGRIGGTLITFSVDAAVLPSAFGGQPPVQAPAQPWYAGPGQALAYTDDAGEIITARAPSYLVSTGPLADMDGEILTTPAGSPLEGTARILGEYEPLMSTERRAAGAQVIITAGEGIGAYTIAEVQPADGGRIRLVLEVAS